jgi:DNA-binding protein YbaB
MPGDPLEDLGRLCGQGVAAREQARQAAAGAVDVRGGDSTGAVTVMLNADGHVATVQVSSDWRRRLDPDTLGDAVRDAAQVAAVARLASWGVRYADESAGSSGITAEPPIRNTFAEQLRDVATARMSGEDRRAA